MTRQARTTTTGVVVDLLGGEATDLAAWEGYVGSHAQATFFHQLGWMRVLERTFQYRPHYLLARRSTQVCGVLPLFACRSILGKRNLYSLPHTVYGGPLSDGPDEERALHSAARDIAARVRARCIEFRNRHRTGLDLPAVDGFVTFEKELPASAEQVYRTFPKKAREAINQARKRHQLEADFGGDFDTFYDLLAASYRSLGTPVFSKRFFASILEEFPRSAHILLVRHNGVAVAGVLSVVFRDTMMPLYSGEASGVAKLRTSNFKYFRLMEHAVGEGLKRFDFGRSRTGNEGVIRFKTNQGFEATPLPYQIDDLRDRSDWESPDPNKGLFLRARGLWRRLPAPVAKILGPRLVRFFP